MEEEIDLRGYVKVIAKRWKWIVGLTVVAVVVAAGASLLVPPTYEATAAISIPQPNPSISYTSLIESTEVEAQVIEMLRASLSPAEQVPGDLIDRVKVSQENDGRLIRITVQSDTSQKAAAVANVWANLSVKPIMEAEDAEEQRCKSLQEQQLQITKQNLEEASRAVIDFEEENGFGVMGFGTFQEELRADQATLRNYRAIKEDIDALIREAQALKESIQGAEAATLSGSTVIAIDSLLQRTEQNLVAVERVFQIISMSEATGYVSFQSPSVSGAAGFAPFRELQADREALRGYEATRDDIEDLLREARFLRDSVQQGGSISSHATISILMRQYSLQAGSTSLGLPEVSTSSALTADEQQEILDAVIFALEARQEAVSVRISEQQERLIRKQGETLGAVIAVLQSKQGIVPTSVEQLAARVAQRESILIDKQPELDDLTRARDIAQQVYEPLATQAEQARLAAKLRGEVSEVEVISPAEEPGAPIRPNRMQVVLIAGTLGLLVGVFGAFVVEYFV